MLGKLIKYEMKAMGRIMLPIYVILLLSSAAVAGFVRYELDDNAFVSSFLSRFGFVTILLFAAVSAAAAVMMAVLVIQRYYKNLLGPEGYLMFSLPATTGQHLISKALSALIWILLGGAAGTLGGMIIVLGSLNVSGYTFQEFLKEAGNVWDSLAGYCGNGNVALGTFLLIFGTLFGLVQVLARVYASFALGHLWNDHRVLGGLCAYIVFSIVESLLQRLMHLSGIMNVYVNYGITETDGAGMLSAGGVGSLIFSVVLLAVYWLIAWYILDKRLNLE